MMEPYRGIKISLWNILGTPPFIGGGGFGGLEAACLTSRIRFVLLDGCNGMDLPVLHSDSSQVP